jgi:D-arabinose 1-dehydrogenase-like Zn-dependent alcohol dehydrogenase
MARYPVVPGHEWVGEVLACGGTVEVIRDGPALKQAGSIAALLRY